MRRTLTPAQRRRLAYAGLLSDALDPDVDQELRERIACTPRWAAELDAFREELLSDLRPLTGRVEGETDGRRWRVSLQAMGADDGQDAALEAIRWSGEIWGEEFQAFQRRGVYACVSGVWTLHTAEPEVWASALAAMQASPEIQALCERAIESERLRRWTL